jgi:hypothetical protein
MFSVFNAFSLFHGLFQNLGGKSVAAPPFQALQNP